MHVHSFYPQHSHPPASLQTVLARQTRHLQIGWFGLACGGGPVMTLGLTEAGLPLTGWSVGQDLIVRVPLEKEGTKDFEVEFQGRLADIRDWYGKVLLRAQVVKAGSPGRQLVGRALQQLCQAGGWRSLFL